MYLFFTYNYRGDYVTIESNTLNDAINCAIAHSHGGIIYHSDGENLTAVGINQLNEDGTYTFIRTDS